MASISKYSTGTRGTLYTRNLGNVGMEFIGNWEEAVEVIRKVPKKVQRAALKVQRNFALLYKTALIENIKGGMAGWKPFSPGYTSWKRRKGKHPNDFYQFDEKYINAIEIKQKGNDITIGISKAKSTTNRQGSLTVAQYAIILEKGSAARNIKPRPLWRPTYKQIRGGELLRSNMKKELNLILKRN